MNLLLCIFISTFSFCSITGLVISEINSDCPNQQTRPLEECEFLELVEKDCNIYGLWEKTPPTYFILLESVGHNGNSPISRLVLNLTDLTVVTGSRFLTICWKSGPKCDYTFDGTLLAHRRSARIIPSYLINGNAYPMVAILLKTNNHIDVWDLLVPEQDASHGKTVTKHGIQFIDQHLV